jgi:hypothetical protein
MARPQGSQNKTTKEVKTILISILDAQLETIQQDLNALAPAKRVEVLLKIASMVLPKPYQEDGPSWDEAF